MTKLPADQARSGTSADTPVHSSAAAAAQTLEIGTKDRPFSLSLLVNRRLNRGGSEKETRHFEIARGPHGPCYEVGAPLGIFPPNCAQLVAQTLQPLARH